MEPINNAWLWVQDRLAERSTWDGGVIIFVSVATFVASPFIKYLAVAGIAYGAWRIWAKESRGAE